MTFPIARVSTDPFYATKRVDFPRGRCWILSSLVSGFLPTLLLSMQFGSFGGFSGYFPLLHLFLGFSWVCFLFLLVFLFSFQAHWESGREDRGGCWSGGGPFPFKVVESTRRKRSFIQLSFQEFHWLPVFRWFTSASQRESHWGWELLGGAPSSKASIEKE